MRSIIALILSWLKKIFRIGTEQPSTTEPVTGDPGTTKPDLQQPDEPFERPGPDPGIVCYYGCPNSKKALKLQLGKKLYR